MPSEDRRSASKSIDGPPRLTNRKTLPQETLKNNNQFILEEARRNTIPNPDTTTNQSGQTETTKIPRKKRQTRNPNTNHPSNSCACGWKTNTFAERWKGFVLKLKISWNNQRPTRRASHANRTQTTATRKDDHAKEKKVQIKVKNG